MHFPDGTSPSKGTALIDLSQVVSSVTGSHGCLFFISGDNEYAMQVSSNSGVASLLGFAGSSITINGTVTFNQGPANYILPFPEPGKSAIYVTYDSLK